jgi:hypothetical protein
MMTAKFSWVGVVLVTNLSDHGKIASKIFHAWRRKHLCKAMPAADTIWCGGGTQCKHLLMQKPIIFVPFYLQRD